MYFLSIDILIKQLLPPNWRDISVFSNNNVVVSDSGKFNLLKVVLKPVKLLLNDFNYYRFNTKSTINLTAETIVIENYLKIITGLSYGIYLLDEINPGSFKVLVPNIVSNKESEIKSFLEKIVPAGRNYQLIFY